MQKLPTALLLPLLMAAPAGLRAADWPQFRGPNCTGRPAADTKLPAEIGPSSHVIWKTALPPGHSSPAVVGDRIYLTAVRDKKLVTLALNRQDGKLVWETEAPAAVFGPVFPVQEATASANAATASQVKMGRISFPVI